MMALWILFCLFASVGLVQCGYWVLEMVKGPKGFRRGYHLIPLYDEPEKLEAQIRFGLSQIRHDGSDCEHTVLVDMGIGEESQQICDRLTSGLGGVYICGIDELRDTISKLDDLQNGLNDVE